MVTFPQSSKVIFHQTVGKQGCTFLLLKFQLTTAAKLEVKPQWVFSYSTQINIQTKHTHSGEVEGISVDVFEDYRVIELIAQVIQFAL